MTRLQPGELDPHQVVYTVRPALHVGCAGMFAMLGVACLIILRLVIG